MIRACSRPRNSKFQPTASHSPKALRHATPPVVVFLGWKCVAFCRGLRRLSNDFFPKFWLLDYFGGRGENPDFFGKKENTIQNGKGLPFWDLQQVIFRRKRCSTSIITREYHIVYAYRFCLELMVRNKQRQQKNVPYLMRSRNIQIIKSFNKCQDYPIANLFFFWTKDLVQILDQRSGPKHRSKNSNL